MHRVKNFTLVELIVVLVIIAIIATIVIPNISGLQGEANLTAIRSNMRNVQTAVDMYTLDNHGVYPTLEQPTPLTPEGIDFNKLYPNYLRDLPQTIGVKYWVDFNGKVWAATVDSPMELKYNEGTISWKTTGEVKKYQIFEVQGYQGVVGRAGNSGELSLVGETTETQFPAEEDKLYVVIL